MKTIFIILTLFSTLALAGGLEDQVKELSSEVQNGGGGICFPDGHCITLAEAGLRVVRVTDPYFQPSPELVEEVRQLIHLLPLSKHIKRKLVENVFANYDTFLKVEAVEPRLYQEMKQAYIKLLTVARSSVQPENFVLFAASDAKTNNAKKPNTYLLPEFFNLSTRSQALTLVHESSVRGQPVSILATALDFDGAFLNLIERGGQLQMADINLLGLMDELGMYALESQTLRTNAPDVVATKLRHFAYTIEKILKRPLRLKEIFEPFESKVFLRSGPSQHEYQLDTSRDALLESQNIHPLLPKLFARIRLQLKNYLYPKIGYRKICTTYPQGEWLIMAEGLEYSPNDIILVKCQGQSYQWIGDIFATSF